MAIPTQTLFLTYSHIKLSETVSVFTGETFRGSLTGTGKTFYAVCNKLNSQSTVSHVPITFLHQLIPAALGV